MKEKIKSLIERSLLAYLKANNINIKLPDIAIEIPKIEKFGDYSTNIAIQLAGKIKRSPQDIAKDLTTQLHNNDKSKYFGKIEHVSQGFINFYFNPLYLQSTLTDVLRNNKKYGQSKVGGKEKILIEYVSANPTGPLHVGHGRWAVIGDVLARALKYVGYHVDTEFYINDVGNQVDMLIRSIEARRKDEPVPEGGYGGQYINDIAKHFKRKRLISDNVLKMILSAQRATLKTLRVRFDKWVSEKDLHEKGKVSQAVKALKDKGVTFNEHGAVWFKSSEFGDDKNRVLVRENGETTYFAADIAYHVDKYKRKYDHLINVWGTDHHGYVQRLKASLSALGFPKEKLEVIIGQLVILYRGKEQVRMSKRTGEMVTLREVMDEIGVDATRYFLARNSASTHLDFDLELAKLKSHENPVYYVQYAHARICSIIIEAKKKRLNPFNKRTDLSLLKEETEKRLLLRILRFPDVVIDAALSRQPHILTNYAEDLATNFHNFYHKCRVVSEDKKLSSARLVIVEAARIVIWNVLELLGVTAPKHM